MKKIVFFILLICGFIFLYFYFGLYGNPISKELSKYCSKKYVEENYKGEEYKLTDVYYNFKTSKYELRFKKLGSLDEYFTIHTNSFGRIKYDNYKDLVLKKWNTYNRLNMELKTQTDVILKDIIDVDGINYGYISFIYQEDFGNYLTLNQKLDLKNLPLELELRVVKYDAVVNYEALAKLLIQIDKQLIDYEMKVDYYDVAIRELGFLDKEEGVQVYVYNLKYEDWIGYKYEIEELIKFLKEHRERLDLGKG